METAQPPKRRKGQVPWRRVYLPVFGLSGGGFFVAAHRSGEIDSVSMVIWEVNCSIQAKTMNSILQLNRQSTGPGELRSGMALRRNT